MSVTTPEWVKDAVFYQIFPDRFAKSERLHRDGLRLEDWDSPPNPFGFKGGDLFGVTEKLDYLQDLGVTAIYFNPIFASPANHRYHTYDYLNVDPILGGNAAFRHLIDEAHARGLRVVPDGVFNHASRGFWQFNHTLENGASSPYVDWFHFDPDRLYGKKHFARLSRSGRRSTPCKKAKVVSKRSVIKRGGTCPRCPNSTPRRPPCANSSGMSPRTGSNSASMAGGWMCRRKSTTTNSGASSAAA